jgi:hypothetical protein
MVIITAETFFRAVAADYWLVADSTAPVLERLDPPRRAAVVMALLALVLTGLALVTCVMVGAHWVRRLARHKPGDRHSHRELTIVAGNRRLPGSLQSILPELKTADTLHLDASTKETKVDR